MTEPRPRTVRAALTLAVAAFLTTIVGGGLTPVPSAAQAAAAATLELRRQTTWWRADQPFELSLAVKATGPENLELAVSIFRKVPSRSEFVATTQGRLAGRPIEEVPAVPLAELATGADGERTLAFTPSIRVDGVYPVRVDLRPMAAPGSGDPPGKAVASLTTYLVHVPSELEAGELTVGLLLPVHAPPAVQPDGRVSIDDARAEQLAELAASIEAATATGFTLAPTPETLEALAASPRDEDRATMATLSRAVGERQILGGPYVPTNVTSMLQAGLGEEVAGQLTRGTAALRSLFGREPTTDTRLIDERLTPEALTSLQGEQQVRRLVVPEPFLDPITRRTTLTNTVEVEGPGGRLPAAVADAGLTSHFAEGDGAIGAQHLLADLAVLYNDDPGAAGRGAVVVAPSDWEPSAAFTTALLDGLATSPILDGVTLDAFFTKVVPATTGSGRRVTTLLRRFAAAPPGSAAAPALPAASVRSERRRIDAFASAVEPTNPIIDRLDRTLLTAQSVDLRARDRLRYLEGVDSQVGGELAKIAMPQNRSITLTAREGELPVTITSGLDYPVRGVLRVASDTLEFPDGADQELDLVRRNTTSQFTVRAQSSGSFPVRVRLESPAGLVLAESRFTVRSTAISGVGTALSIGAALFLLVWWGNHLRGRRSRRLLPSATTASTATDA